MSNRDSHDSRKKGGSPKRRYPVIESSSELLARDPLEPAYVLLNASIVGGVWKLQKLCLESGWDGALARGLEGLVVYWEEGEQEMMEQAAMRVALVTTKIGLEREKARRRNY